MEWKLSRKWIEGEKRIEEHYGMSEYMSVYMGVHEIVYKKVKR